jgi:hypothetical protein
MAFLFDGLAGCDLHVGSVFGHSAEGFDVLFSGEWVDGLRHDGENFVFRDRHTQREGKAKWFMGIPRILHPRAMWIPLFYLDWARYLRGQPPAYPDTEREFGVSVVVSNFHNGALTRLRGSIAHRLSLFVPVHANRAFRRSAPSFSRVVYHDVPDKLVFLSRYTHHLCYENEARPGYLTEKLFDPLFVGAVPLYAGDPLAGEWVSNQGFFDCAGLTPRQIASQVIANKDIVEVVDTQRHGLCRVPFEEMESRIRDFTARIQGA